MNSRLKWSRAQSRAIINVLYLISLFFYKLNAPIWERCIILIKNAI